MVWPLRRFAPTPYKKPLDPSAVRATIGLKAEILQPKDNARAAAIIASSKVKDLIEFSRAVHAEMHAILLGNQMNGDRVKGGKLFCTTYPCHSCARHIVAAGIKEVYYTSRRKA
jgi:deoxycytidylate deaminase